MIRSLLSIPLFAIGALVVDPGGCSGGKVVVGTDEPDGSSGTDAGSGPDAGGGGGGCTTSADCANGGLCGYLESDGCSAVGHCFPAPGGPKCLIASAVGCGCDGHAVSIDPSCYSGLPSGYQLHQVLHEGACGDAASPDAGPLTWFLTCGGPTCPAGIDGGPPPDAGFLDDAGAPCAKEGSSCSALGETCGTGQPLVSCGASLVCSDHDPRAHGCPVSSRKFKDDVEYVESAELERLHDEALRIRLATYRYKPAYGEPNQKHLGFIIEDDPQSPAVQAGRDRVDLYGYVSMAVATMQVQEKEIAKLRRELTELRARTGKR